MLQKNQIQIQSSHKIKINHQGYKGIVPLLKTIRVWPINNTPGHQTYSS